MSDASDIFFEIEGDVLVKYTPIPERENAYKTEIVMTKDIFQECYRKWIEKCIKQEGEQ